MKNKNHLRVFDPATIKSKRGQIVQDYLGYIILAVIALILILGIIFVASGKFTGMIDYFKQLVGFR